jgi:hypothetical protein
VFRAKSVANDVIKKLTTHVERGNTDFSIAWQFRCASFFRDACARAFALGPNARF